jgi:hypothetical protein
MAGSGNMMNWDSAASLWARGIEKFAGKANTFQLTYVGVT